MKIIFHHVVQLAVIALMLLMQLATVVHALEHHHHDGQHNEHCVVCIMSDQTADPSIRDVSIDNTTVQFVDFFPHYVLYAQPTSLYQYSRAPPRLA